MHAEGIIFIILAVTGLRMRLIRMVPRSIMLATSAGIGLYLVRGACVPATSLRHRCVPSLG